jgi:hypothetical protein
MAASMSPTDSSALPPGYSPAAGRWKRSSVRWSRIAVVVNGDLGNYMRYYKERYRDERHLARYDPGTIERLNLAS